MKRLNSILRDKEYEQHIRKNAVYEHSRVQCCHNFQHMLDVARIAYILMLENDIFTMWLNNELRGDADTGKEVIYTAALLHDIGRWEEYDTGESHALVGAHYTKALMLKHHFSAHETGLVVRAIKEHRAASTPHTTLGIYLHRSDKLSRLCWCCGRSGSMQTLARNGNERWIALLIGCLGEFKKSTSKK